MLQYDGDLQLPRRFLVAPPAITNTTGEWFSTMGVAQFACSETQKFGHVTYFWNGNRSGKFAGETWQEVPSDVVPFEQRPWMKAAEITDAMIAALQIRPVPDAALQLRQWRHGRPHRQFPRGDDGGRGG